jgi:hypothetical protein
MCCSVNARAGREAQTIIERAKKGKKVFVRVDFNVPMDENGAITDDARIRAALPTIRYALQQDAKIILASHLGRPKGKPEAQYSLAPVARRLGELLHKEVRLAPDCVGAEVEAMAKALKPGENELEVKVANLWPNRMIGDALSAGSTSSQSGRITFSTFNPFKPASPLPELKASSVPSARVTKRVVTESLCTRRFGLCNIRLMEKLYDSS